MYKRTYAVYIMASPWNTVLYTGVTNNLLRRVLEHKEKRITGFTQRYNVTKLVYFELTDEIEGAILREKQIKKWRREKKEVLINSFNPGWKDLYSDIVG